MGTDVQKYTVKKMSVNTRKRAMSSVKAENTWIEFDNDLAVWLTDSQVRELIALLAATFTITKLATVTA